GVGRALAESCARRGFDLRLVARDATDLDAVAADCSIRHGIIAKTLALDLGDEAFRAASLIEWLRAAGGGVDHVFLTAGAIDSADTGLPPEPALLRLTRVNYLSLAQIMTAMAAEAPSLGLRTLLACSSIAASAPRGKNMAYAAAKSALATFCLGMRHHLAATGVKVQVYRLGYVDTSMTFGQKLLLPVVSPAVVAERMCRDLDKDIGDVFFPGYWRWIVAGLRVLPWPVYRRLKF
ncbi:MAG: SDR family NAD(P)-dependent oxidoreductase, partial [Gemmatimonadales bacterium]